MRPYFAELGSCELFTPEQELEQARLVEETELTCWRLLLSNPSTTGYVLERLAERAGEEAPDATALREAVGTARTAAAPDSDDTLLREIDRVARLLRQVSSHWDLLESVLADLRAWSDNRRTPNGLHADDNVRGWLQQVLNAQRLAAQARNRFISANLRLVFSTARRYVASRIPFADLVQEGNLGLIRAIDKFDHRRGLRFCTYAGWWIRHMISRSVTNRSRAVRVPSYLLELRSRIDRVAQELERELGREPTDAEIAESAGVAESKVEETRLHCQWHEWSLDEQLGEDGDGASRHDVFQDPEDESEDPFQLAAAAADRSTVAELLAEIPPREREIIEKRFGLHESGREWTLRELAREHDLSRERIRQLEKKAMKRLREAFQRRQAA